MANSPAGAVTAQLIAQAYDVYAKQAIAMTAVPALPGAPGALPALIGVMVPVMSVPNPVPGLLEKALMAGLPLYWAMALYTGPPIPPAPAPTVSLPGGIQLPGIAALIGTMTPPTPSSAIVAQRLGMALHTITSSAIVAFATAPPGVLL